MNQPIRAGLNSAVGAVGIGGRPRSRAVDFAWLYLTVADGRAGKQSCGEGDGINERLEGRTDLAICRRQRAVEFALRIIAATNQGTDPAAPVIDGNDGAFQVRH